MQLLLLVFHLDFELLPSHQFLGLLHVTIGKVVDPKMQRSIGLRLVRIDDLRKICVKFQQLFIEFPLMCDRNLLLILFIQQVSSGLFFDEALLAVELFSLFLRLNLTVNERLRGVSGLHSRK